LENNTNNKIKIYSQIINLFIFYIIEYLVILSVAKIFIL